MKKAFTLVEVMIVVGIAGLIMVVGLAPLVYSVRLMSEARAAFTEESRERNAVNAIAQGARELVSNGVSGSLRLLRNGPLEGRKDYLLLWTLSPSYARLPMGTIVFGMPPDSVLGDDYQKGLYRWLLSDDKRPGVINVDELKPENGRLILAGVENVGFDALSGGEWLDEYMGDMPQALRVFLKYGEERGEEEKNYDIWLPKS
ncbi:MAG: type II secretion system GspH family protein [Synergistaceae bacterium]|jgi:prepilin-type N-terminal cleavage/methylation domain-containing protein|nr:type II secretion system GspH family protein [Synergistaceae bacterium]